MKEPCRSCARRDIDFGGCRCQAFALTGDAANPDPVCTLTPARSIIDAAIAEAAAERGSDTMPAYLYRSLDRELTGAEGRR
jgi:pyrroloquinoline quinone biosynthesis protein E